MSIFDSSIIARKQCIPRVTRAQTRVICKISQDMTRHTYLFVN